MLNSNNVLTSLDVLPIFTNQFQQHDIYAFYVAKFHRNFFLWEPPCKVGNTPGGQLVWQQLHFVLWNWLKTSKFNFQLCCIIVTNITCHVDNDDHNDDDDHDHHDNEENYDDNDNEDIYVTANMDNQLVWILAS